MTDDLMTISEMARHYRVGRKTIGDIVVGHRLIAKAVARNGNAKGYDAKDRRVIERAIGYSKRPATATA